MLVVVGFLGVLSGQMEGFLKNLGVPDVLGGFQVSAAIGIRRCLVTKPQH